MENKDFKSMATPNEEIKDQSRRGFLKGLLGAGAALVAGAGLTVVGNRFIENERKFEDLSEKFKKGQEDNYDLAKEAVALLKSKMVSLSIVEININKSNNNDEIDLLRDFLNKHLNGEKGKHYSSRDKILQGGVYNIAILDEILEKMEIHENR